MRERHTGTVGRWVALAACTAGLLGLLATGCGSDTTPTTQNQASNATQPPKTPVPGGELVVALSAEADGYNPTVNRWGSSTLMVARSVFDPLMSFDEKGQPKPYLAEAFTPNSDFTVWTIRLRSGIAFHNGEPLNADALLLDLNMLKTSAVTHDVFKPVASYDKTDDLTVKATLSAPWAQFPSVFASQTGFIAAPAQLSSPTTSSTEPIGTGPFVFQEWKIGEQFSVARNDKYWRKDDAGKSLPYLKSVKFKPTTDPQKRTTGLKNNDFNMIQTESPEEVIEYAKAKKDGASGDIKVLLDEGEGSEESIVMNTQTGPFADKDLRVAASKAIDRNKMIATLYQGYYQPAVGPFSAKSVWGGPDSPIDFDAAGAKKITDDYKAAHGGQKPKVILTIGASADQAKLGQYIQTAWNDAGFDASIDTQDEKAITVKVVTGTYDSVLYTFWDRPDPDNMAHYWLGENVPEPGQIGLNFAKYKSDVVDTALKEGRTTTDEQKRIGIYKRVWNDFAANQPIVWLYHSQWVIAYGATVQNVGNFTLPDGTKGMPIAWGNIYLTQVWIER